MRTSNFDSILQNRGHGTPNKDGLTKSQDKIRAIGIKGEMCGG